MPPPTWDKVIVGKSSVVRHAPVSARRIHRHVGSDRVARAEDQAEWQDSIAIRRSSFS